VYSHSTTVTSFNHYPVSKRLVKRTQFDPTGYVNGQIDVYRMTGICNGVTLPYLDDLQNTLKESQRDRHE
jgi:hypothetical protein